MFKKLMAILMALVIVTGCFAAYAAAPTIKKVEYDSGIVEVDFRKKVQYKNVGVKVTDSEGKEYTAYIIEKDNDEISFKPSGLTAGRKYSFVISGIRARGTSAYSSVKGTFTAPGGVNSKIKITNIDSDASDDEIEIEFSDDVEYNKLKVTVKNSSGKSLRVYIEEKDSDSIDLFAVGLLSGKKYTITVSGVRAYGSDGDYQKITKTFIAHND